MRKMCASYLLLVLITCCVRGSSTNTTEGIENDTEYDYDYDYNETTDELHEYQAYILPVLPENREVPLLAGPMMELTYQTALERTQNNSNTVVSSNETSNGTRDMDGYTPISEVIDNNKTSDDYPVFTDSMFKEMYRSSLLRNEPQKSAVISFNETSHGERDIISENKPMYEELKVTSMVPSDPDDKIYEQATEKNLTQTVLPPNEREKGNKTPAISYKNTNNEKEIPAITITPKYAPIHKEATLFSSPMLKSSFRVMLDNPQNSSSDTVTSTNKTSEDVDMGGNTSMYEELKVTTIVYSDPDDKIYDEKDLKTTVLPPNEWEEGNKAPGSSATRIRICQTIFILSSFLCRKMLR